MNIYDFDDTIYDGDTTFEMIGYSLLRHPFKVLRSFFTSIKYYIGYKRNKNSYEMFKEVLFSFLFKIDNQEKYIDNFIETRKHKIKKWYLDNKKENDLVISGSYELWIIPFCNKIGIKYAMGTKTDKNGKIIDKNCKHEEKVRRINKEYKNITINEAYSDSLTDIPMLELAKKPFIVKGNKLIPYVKEK